VLARLPAAAKSAHNFSDTGRILCDAPLADLLRASATKSSWSSIIGTVNELKATAWTRDVVVRYLRICDLLAVAPSCAPEAIPAQSKLSSDWARNLYLGDFHKREQEITQELRVETGDDILKVDWTRGAAARCKAHFMLNLSTGANKILASVLTATSAPHDAEPALQDLCRRGVSPKVVYVDEECCGTWPEIINRLWPNCCVRLDPLHALMRLTRTTVSTQHPWHGKFCGMLSDALFEYSGSVRARIHKAMARQRRGEKLSRRQMCKYVPRNIRDAKQIAHNMERVIANFKEQAHCDMGVLVTAGTDMAWENLRKHVLKGCLCDPTGVDVESYEKYGPLVLGGRAFPRVRSHRGTSSLEGFHGHQKRWLGPLGTHAPESGMALVADGSVRWNRQRINESLPEAEHTPPVFAPGLLQEARDLQRQLSESTLGAMKDRACHTARITCIFAFACNCGALRDYSQEDGG